MRGHCYAVVSGKGGVGKTTTTVNTAHELADIGFDVVVVDADLAMANLGQMVGIERKPTVHDVLAEEAALSEAIDTSGAVAVLPGSAAIDSFRAADPAKLGPVIKRLRTAFDIVIMDTGAGVDHETMLSCGAADDIILVTTAHEAAVDDTKKSQAMAEKVDGQVLGTVVTRSDEPTAGRVADELETNLLGAVPDVPETVGEEPVVTHAPESAVATAYSEVAKTLAVRVDSAPESEQVVTTDS